MSAMKNKNRSRHTSTRVDSIAGARASLKAACMGTLMPPSHIALTKQEVPFWIDLIECRARQLWTSSDLALAAHLARAKANLEQYERDVKKEPLVLQSKTGRIYKNPKLEQIEILSVRILKYSRVLHIHAQSAVGRTKNGLKKLEDEKQKRALYASLKDNGLIPFPK